MAIDESRFDYTSAVVPDSIQLNKLDFSGRDAMKVIQERFANLGPDGQYALYCYSQGMKPKEFRSHLKKLRKK
jgi:hypothetical protein